MPFTKNKNGMTNAKTSESTTNFQVTCEVKRDLIHKSHRPDGVEFSIKQELAQELSREILTSDMVKVVQMADDHDSLMSDNARFKAYVNIAPPGEKFMIVEHDYFVVNGEKFTEAEVIESIKNTFPERLI